MNPYAAGLTRLEDDLVRTLDVLVEAYAQLGVTIDVRTDDISALMDAVAAATVTMGEGTGLRWSRTALAQAGWHWISACYIVGMWRTNLQDMAEAAAHMTLQLARETAAGAASLAQQGRG